MADLWRKFLDADFNPPDLPYRTRERLVCRCTTCGSHSYVILSNLKKQVKKLGTHLCWSCSSRKSALANKERYNKTMLERYGATNPNKVPEIVEKIKKTNKKRYGEGGSIALARKAFKQKHKVDNPFTLEAVKDKIKATNLERYGVESLLALPEVREKGLEAIRAKYGHVSALKGALLQRNGCTSYEQFALKVADFIENNAIPANSKEAEDAFQTDGTTLIAALRSIDREDLVRDTNTSRGEQDLFFFIKSIYAGEVQRNLRGLIGRKELDIYLPDLKIAFEYNGEYWHSEKFVTEGHRDFLKYRDAMAAGITLYTIYESEWVGRNAQIKQFVKNIVNQKESIPARKTTITTDRPSLIQFLKTHHIQGSGKASEFYGLEFEGQIVMAIAIRRHHRNYDKMVLSRVCFSDKSVIGGLEKLLKNQPYDRLITWSNNRLSPHGKMYENAGFVLEKELPPDYNYIDGAGNFYTKQSMRKAATNCPSDKTERQWCLDNGLYRIWDCGKKRWVWERKKT